MALQYALGRKEVPSSRRTHQPKKEVGPPVKAYLIATNATNISGAASKTPAEKLGVKGGRLSVSNTELKVTR